MVKNCCVVGYSKRSVKGCGGSLTFTADVGRRKYLIVG